MKDARIIISAPSYEKPAEKPQSSICADLALERNHEFGICSYKEGYRASRKTKILFKDLKTGERGEFSFGKTNRIGFGRALPEKNSSVHISLRLYPLEGQNLEITKTISSHHFDLVVMKGRLYIVDLSSFGTSLSGRPLPKGIPVQIQKGDRIAPFTRSDYVSGLSFMANFQIQDKKLTSVELVKRGE